MNMSLMDLRVGVKHCIAEMMFLPFRGIGMFFLLMVGFVLPDRSKRVILAGSLYSHLKGLDIDEINDDEIKRIADELNSYLYLTGVDDRALMLPAMLHRAIWARRHIMEHIDECSSHGLDYCSEFVLSAVPMWLRYNPKAMGDDISQVIHWCVLKKKVTNVE